MKCPVCKNDSVSFGKAYKSWYGTTKCSECNTELSLVFDKFSSFKKYLLIIITLLTSYILAGTIWYIPAFIVYFILDSIIDIFVRDCHFELKE